MKPKPKIVKFYDDDEKALYKAIEADDYQPGENQISEAEKDRLQKIARNTINEERAKISLRIPRSDLAKIKAKAVHEGVPYQTLINSILHKAIQS
jgi:predicted DNA binding CopG/RHH family protein